eukprot:4138039-Amphidinium_carterae.1
MEKTTRMQRAHQSRQGCPLLLLRCSLLSGAKQQRSPEPLAKAGRPQWPQAREQEWAARAAGRISVWAAAM